MKFTVYTFEIQERVKIKVPHFVKEDWQDARAWETLRCDYPFAHEGNASIIAKEDIGD